MTELRKLLNCKFQNLCNSVIKGEVHPESRNAYYSSYQYNIVICVLTTSEVSKIK